MNNFDTKLASALSVLAESASAFYTVMPGTADRLSASPRDKCWLDNAESIDAMSVYLNDFTVYGEGLDNEEYSLYQFIAPAPVSLPMNLSLNPIYPGNGNKLSPDDLKDAIAWISKFDSSTLINSQYEDNGQWTKGRASGRELKSVLADIVVSLGECVWNPEDGHPNMKHQVIVNGKFKMTRVNHESITNPDAQFDFDSLKDKVVKKIHPAYGEQDVD